MYLRKIEITWKIYLKSTCQVNKNHWQGTSLVVKGLRLHGSKAGGPGLIPGHRTRSQMPQLRPGTAKL